MTREEFDSLKSGDLIMFSNRLNTITVIIEKKMHAEIGIYFKTANRNYFEYAVNPELWNIIWKKT